MKKIPCVFERDFSDRRQPVLLRSVTPGCEWVVLAEEGIATRKWDGTSVLVQGGKVFARYDAKAGKAPPAGAIPCDPAPDALTGHWPHWVEAVRPEDRWIREAAANTPRPLLDGTYEAVGPKIGANPERLERHTLMPHGGQRCEDVVRTFDGLREWLAVNAVEGIVFHHPDGRMAKIRRADFGIPWPVREAR